MPGADLLGGRLLLWATAFAAAAGAGLLAPPVVAPRLALGPAVGAGLFLVLARRLPPLPRRRPALLAGRAAYVSAAAAFEELLWRGLALGLLQRPLGQAPALLLTSVAFALGHRRPRGARRVVHAVTGLGLGTAFLVGGLAAAVLAHASYNVLVDVAVQGGRRDAPA
jgi:membrane protease YdiL (CAAX protease family)